LLPAIRSVFHEFKFRIKAIADGLSMGYTDEISVTLINCDYQGPLLKDDIEIIEIEQVRNFRTKF
jgi:hypothetical protein